MAEETIKSKLEELVTHSTEMGETAYKLAKLKAVQKTVNFSATFIFTIIATFLFIFILFFSSVAAAWWLGNILQSRVAGFFIMAGFFLLLLVIILLLKGKSIIPFIRNKIVSKIYE